jgi:hypothetical protein
VGRETTCRAHLGAESSKGKAHLESTSLRFTGDFRFNVPFDQMHNVTAKDGTLSFQAPVGAVKLELGDVAERWANQILNPKSRLDKLEVKPESIVCVVAIDDELFLAELAARLESEPAGVPEGQYDLIFHGLEAKRDLGVIRKLRPHLVRDGALWLVYRKGKHAPISESDVRDAFLSAKLVDVKVVSFSSTHTAVKLVIPKHERSKSD